MRPARTTPAKVSVRKIRLKDNITLCAHCEKRRPLPAGFPLVLRSMGVSICRRWQNGQGHQHHAGNCPGFPAHVKGDGNLTD